jgi:acetylserotonin N-methyltransferase
MIAPPRKRNAPAAASRLRRTPDARPVEAAVVVDLIEGFRRSKTLFAAVTLRVFEGRRLKSGSFYRLLDACRAAGLLQKEGSEYVNTAVAERYLREDSPHSLVGYIRYSNEILYPLWAHLEDAVCTSAPPWAEAFGPGASVTGFMKDARRKRDFLTGMHGYGMLSSPAVVRAFDLSRFRRLVDLGGATGHLAGAATERYPGMKATLFDLPRVIELVRDKISSGVEILPGDFWQDPLPQADLFAMGKILHSQDDETSRKLLERVQTALPSGGAVLLAEALLDEDRCGPVWVHMQSLNMLVVNGGRERTLGEYRDLLEAAGFRNVEGRRTGAPLDAILALKP